MADAPKLLSGGNPQIPMGYGEAPVRAYLDAAPGWKQPVCRRIDEIVSQLVPDVRKAVKWNSPFYGLEQDRWFLSFHCFERYVKVSFFRGAELDPPPREKSKHPLVRYHHVHDPALGPALRPALETDELGEQFAAWVRQASALPGEKM